MSERPITIARRAEHWYTHTAAASGILIAKRDSSGAGGTLMDDNGGATGDTDSEAEALYSHGLMIFSEDSDLDSTRSGDELEYDDARSRRWKNTSSIERDLQYLSKAITYSLRHQFRDKIPLNQLTLRHSWIRALGGLGHSGSSRLILGGPAQKRRV